jgi:heme/copper-type cytochrome/quinol oxidase subunit 2
MLNKIKTLIAGVMAASFLALGILPTLSAQAGAAAIQQSACQGANLDLTSANASTCQTTTADSSSHLNSIIANIINAFSVIVGLVAVVMIIFGGFRYVTSGGESGNISNAKNTILYAIIGLVIVAFAQFIVKFVLAKATGVNETASSS